MNVLLVVLLAGRSHPARSRTTIRPKDGRGRRGPREEGSADSTKCFDDEKAHEQQKERDKGKLSWEHEDSDGGFLGYFSPRAPSSWVSPSGSAGDLSESPPSLSEWASDLSALPPSQFRGAEKH